MSPLLETLAVTRTELLRTLRNARVLVLLLLFGTCTALVGLVVGLLTRSLDTQGPEAAAAASAGILGFLVGEDGAALQHLSELPLLVPLVFRATLFFLPLFIALLGYDQLSGEVADRQRSLPRGALAAGKHPGREVPGARRWSWERCSRWCCSASSSRARGSGRGWIPSATPRRRDGSGWAGSPSPSGTSR